MNNFEYTQFIAEWKRACKSKDDAFLIEGQVFYNLLRIRYPDVAEKIDGTDLDPFYDSNRIPAAMEFIEELIQDE